MTDRAVLLGGLSLIAGSLLLNHFQEETSAEDVSKCSATSPEAKETSAGGEQYPDEIKHEIHSRVKTFFSEQGFQKLQDSFIIVSFSSVSRLQCCVSRRLTSSITLCRLLA